MLCGYEIGFVQAIKTHGLDRAIKTHDIDNMSGTTINLICDYLKGIKTEKEVIKGLSDLRDN